MPEPTKKLLFKLIEGKFDHLDPRPKITCRPGIIVKKLLPSSGFENARCFLCSHQFQPNDSALVGEMITHAPNPNLPKWLFHKSCYEKQLDLAEKQVRRRVARLKADGETS